MTACQAASRGWSLRHVSGNSLQATPKHLLAQFSQ